MTEKTEHRGAVAGGLRAARSEEQRDLRAGDVWFVLTTQTDALRHVCLYGIHMLSWEIRGQRHTARIHDASAETTSMAPARARTRPCGGAYFWSIHSHSFAPQLPHTFPFALLCKKCGHRQHPQPGPPDPQPRGKEALLSYPKC